MTDVELSRSIPLPVRIPGADGRRPGRRIGVFVFDGVKLLDAVGPAEVFVEANQFVEDPYDVVFMSPDGRDVQTSIGANLAVQRASADSGEFDTVIVPGSEKDPRIFVTDGVAAGVRHLSLHTRRLVSICSGAFVLATLGMLDGKRATTHWKFVGELARLYPAIQVEPDSIFVRDGTTYSSAGVAAGVDLALALVEEDHGPDIARIVAQSLLVYMQRSGGQSQFSSSLRAPVPKNQVVRKVTEAIRADPTLTISELASAVNVSVRHLNRLFRDEMDTSPSQYITALRFDIAVRCLESGAGVNQAALDSGFSGAQALRRIFASRLGISPGQYQQRFLSTTAS
jgi:transcriptional regulator GlxA family with amidase domain